MSLQKLDNSWMRFGVGGIRWRCIAPRYFCEVLNEGNVPVYADKALMLRMKEVRSYYAQRMRNLGLVDSFGYGVDALVANVFAESSGVVPSPVDTVDLERDFAAAQGDIGARLDNIARNLRGNKRTKQLVRMEHGYSNPVSSPNKISMGAHHALVSTAAWLQGTSRATPEQIRKLVLRLPSDSTFSAQVAVNYFNRTYSKHLNQPPLMAACYNAGSLRVSTSNSWNLQCTNNHIDRWVMYFNMSRSVVAGTLVQAKVTPIVGMASSISASTLADQVVIPQSNARNINAGMKVSVERVIAALRRKNYPVFETDDNDYNLNIVGIRDDNARVNYFDDTLFVFWKYRGQWFSREYYITTYPGRDYLGEKMVNRKGTAILKEGHYKGSHKVGFHKQSSPGRYEALVQRGNLSVYRDNNHDGKFDLRSETIDTGAGFGVNIHRARAGGVTVNVGAYSAGCQVFAQYEQWVDFHSLFKKASANWGDTFSYTLINKKDLE